jgi:membrane-associated phospholipid phosphatase
VSTTESSRGTASGLRGRRSRHGDRHWLKRYAGRLRPSDKLSLLWLLVTAVPAVLMLPGYLQAMHINPLRVLVPHAAGIIALLVLPALTYRSVNPWVIFIRSWYPVLVVPLMFTELYYLIPAVNPHDADALLQRLEIAIFGTIGALWMQRLYWPPLTELMFIAYAAFYFLPLVPGIPLYLAGDRRKFDRFVFLLMLNYYGAFAIYFLLPSVGPGIALAEQFTRELRGVFASDWIYRTIHSMEGIHHDCFPSVHTAIALVVVGYLYLHRWYSFLPLIPVSVATVFATIYCRYHYTPDILAGIVLAVVSLVVYRRLYRVADWGRP